MGLLRKDCSLTAEWQTAVAISCGRSLIPTAVLIIKQIALIVFFCIKLVLFIYLLIKDLFIYWKDRYTERKDREQDLLSDDSHHKWAQRMTLWWSEARIHKVLPGVHRCAGSQGFGLSSTAFPSHNQGAGWEVVLPGLEPAAVWDPSACKARTLANRPRLWAPSIGFNINCLYF